MKPENGGAIASERPVSGPGRITDVLVCESDPELLSRLATVLRDAGLRPVSARTGRQAISEARGRSLHAAIIALDLVDIRGLELCTELRARSGDMPIIAICPAVPMRGEVQALRDCGVDDFVTKPFSARELFLRLSIALRGGRPRANGAQPVAAPVLRLGDLELDEDARRVDVHGEQIPLTPIEYELLRYLMRRPDRAVTYDALVQHLWGTSTPGGDERNTLRSHMSNLRRKLSDRGVAHHIKTEMRVGYRFVAGATVRSA